jgi:SAM-dependent methyltransferase
VFRLIGCDVPSRFDWRTRSIEPERLDGPDFSGPELVRALRDIARFNRWLGGHRSLIRGVKYALTRLPQRPLTVVDIGCGSGDGLRALSRWSSVHGVAFELHGLDANPAVIEVARSLSLSFPNVRYHQGDAFGDALTALQPDIVIANQFLHHFSSLELASRIPQVLSQTKAFVVSDLHRHRLAHLGFDLLARLFGASPVALHDGKVSIRRGFTRAEFETLTAALDCKHFDLNWSFPFRFELVLLR